MSMQCTYGYTVYEERMYVCLYWLWSTDYVQMCEFLWNEYSFIMACRLFSAKLLPKPMLTSWHLGPPGAKPWWDLNQNTTLFMHLKIHVYLKNMGHFVQLSKCCPLKCWNWYIPSKPCQNHGCWCPGSLCCQAISIYAIDCRINRSWHSTGKDFNYLHHSQFWEMMEKEKIFQE